MTHIFISFLFYNIILFIFYVQYRRGLYYINKQHLVFYTVLLIAFGTYGGGEGDYLHYKEIVEEIHTLGDVFIYTSMEKQYNYLAYLLDGNYHLWRFIVYSIQFIGLGWFLKKAKLNTYPVLVTFTSLFLVTSVYGRVYWGGIYYFMGLYLLIEKKNPFYLIAILLCFVSHTSNLILIALLPLGFIRLRRWYFLIIICSAGIILALFNDYFNLLIESGGVDGAEYLNSKLSNYSKSTNYLNNFFGNSIGEKIIFLLRHIPILFILLSIFKLFMTSYNRYKSIYKPLQRVINVYLGINLVALVFLFADMNNGTYFYRVLAMTFFPLTLILPSMIRIGNLRAKTFNLYILMFILTTEASYFKDLYYAYSEGNF